MMEKYYTPTLNEFHFGFEYEANNHDKWEKLTFGTEKPSIGQHIPWKSQDGIESFNLERVRVKYLDQLDIESLGWKYILNKSIIPDFELTPIIGTTGKLILTHDWLNYKITIKTPNYIRDGSGNFDGYINYVYGLKIKNKSELRRLMQQLQIL